MAEDASAPVDGVAFPEGGDGRRSTSATGRAIFADCIRAVDPDVAARIEHTADWRGGYIGPLRSISLASALDGNAALSVSRDGLDSAHRRFIFAREGEQTLLWEAMRRWTAPGYGSVTVRGLQPREVELTLPYRGRRLFGDDLRRQIDVWIARGIAEPGFAEALNLVLDNPDWLDLSDVDIAVLGAGAELGPTRSLLRWGARVHAVDLPRPDLWQRLIDTTRNTAGSLRIPIALDADGNPPFFVGGFVHPDDDATVASKAGADLLKRTPEILTWLEQIEQPFVLGMYAYADGAAHVLLSMAADALVTEVTSRRDDVTLAYLATPTDVFMVPIEAVEASRERWESRGLGGLLQSPLRLLKQFQPNYPRTYTADDGTPFGINDSLVPQQGPNYALAKRLQRWRGLVARADGIPVSLNLAPATRTHSVVKNRALSAAYAGASRFGVEVFEPATSTTLMAALLVHDLRNPAAAANPDTVLANPMDLFAAAANHGGLWRAAYEPRSVLGIAALLGMFEARA
ncbi:MAG: hypothetical protein GC156_07190 [Actinomycetales bacterium]|nr:hypothetical protein [Actinomycetales bacterium]